MSNAQSATSPAAAFPADFVALLSEALTGGNSPANELAPTNSPAVEYTVGEEDDGYYD